MASGSGPSPSGAGLYTCFFLRFSARFFLFLAVFSLWDPVEMLLLDSQFLCFPVLFGGRRALLFLPSFLSFLLSSERVVFLGLLSWNSFPVPVIPPLGGILSSEQDLVSDQFLFLVLVL